MYTNEPDNEVNRFIDNKELDAMEKHEREGSPYGGKQFVNVGKEAVAREKKTSFADLGRKSQQQQQQQNQFATSGINITYSEGDEKEDQPKRVSGLLRRDSQKERGGGSSTGTPVKTSWSLQSQPDTNPGSAFESTAAYSILP